MSRGYSERWLRLGQKPERDDGTVPAKLPPVEQAPTSREREGMRWRAIRELVERDHVDPGLATDVVQDVPVEPSRAGLSWGDIYSDARRALDGDARAPSRPRTEPPPNAEPPTVRGSVGNVGAKHRMRRSRKSK